MIYAHDVYMIQYSVTLYIGERPASNTLTIQKCITFKTYPTHIVHIRRIHPWESDPMYNSMPTLHVSCYVFFEFVCCILTCMATTMERCIHIPYMLQDAVCIHGLIRNTSYTHIFRAGCTT